MSTDTEPYNINSVQSAHYDNCQIFHPDGTTLLGHCDRHKLSWYLKKGLAESIDNTSIKLLFTPKNASNRPVGQTKFDNQRVTIKRENKCSACCSVINLRKFHVIPTEYKKLFPLDVKSHSSTDIVLLCTRCLSDANFCSNEFKKKKEAEYGVSKADFIDSEKEKLKMTAIRYLKRIDSINAEMHPITKEDLDKVITTLSDILGYVPTDEEIRSFTTLNSNKQKDSASSVPEYIVAKVIASNKLDEFIKAWKENYIDMMAPDYVPEDFMT